MSLARRLIQSFSFRLLFVTMLIFFMAMLAIRMGIYHTKVGDALDEVKGIIDEQYYQIDKGIAKRGVQHGMNLIAAILHFDIENSFAVAYMDETGLMREGNLTAWPEAEQSEGEWFIFRVAVLPEDSAMSDDDARVLGGITGVFKKRDLGLRSFLARIHTYPNGDRLLVGYDLRHVEQVRNLLFNVLVEGVIISLLAAIVCSLLVAWWINRRLRMINRTCTQVIAGDLDERAPVSGAGDEFDQLSTNFNAMLAWINQLIHSIKDTTNALAHDMRTPLSRHRIHLTGLLDRPDLPDTYRIQIQTAVDEIDRIVELYDNILNISRAESRTAVESFTAFNLCDMLTDVIELYEPFAEQRSASIHLDCDPKLSLTGERQLVAQAAANLIDNALKYAPEESSVTIKAFAQQHDIIIQVSDSGPGIPAEEREKVKERFYRLDKSRSTPGTGLGLSLVNAVMQLHGGSFTLSDNAPGLKATLRFKHG
jgi:signal transduction histidine kinase